MDLPESPANSLRLCGTLLTQPVYSHSARAQDFFSFVLEVRRLSGTADLLNVLVREEQLTLPEGKLCITGELRSFNNRRGDWPKLVISVFAKSLRPTEEADLNLVQLRGTLCKPPQLRSTPLGRDICDLMLAVNRHYGRSDYLPCITWGYQAQQSARYAVGTKLSLSGRIQSRQYRKLCEPGIVERIAYEVSATQCERIDAEAVLPML